MRGKPNENDRDVQVSIQPWITVTDALKASTFYQEAFGAKETYRLAGENGGYVIRLNVESASFWINSPGKEEQPGSAIRMILTVSDPDTIVGNSLKAGAELVFPVGEEYGWRLGRIIDPFGLHWEIGYEI